MTDNHTRNASGKPGTPTPTEAKRASSRPPPSIAPPTDDIDAEWGASPEPVAAALKPAPVPKIEQPPAQTPNGSQRKQTLLGLAPPNLTKSAPPPAVQSATMTPLANLVKPASVPPAARPASIAPGAAASSPSVAPSSAGSASRKGTLLGLAPPVVPTASSAPPASASVTPTSASASATPSSPSASVTPTSPSASATPTSAIAAKAASSEAKLAASAAAVAKAQPAGATTESDAPLTADVPSTRAKPHTEAPPSSTAATQASRAPQRAGGGNLQLIVLFAAAAGVAGYFATRRGPADSGPAAAERPVAVQSVIEPPPAPPEPVAAAPSVVEPALTATATPSPSAAAVPVPAVASAASGAAATPPAPSAAPSVATATADVQQIHIVTDPAGARLYWKGKDIGVTPLTIELPAGEKRSYEVALRGFITRKLFVDGSKTDIGVGMRPLPVAPPTAAPAGDEPAATPSPAAPSE